MNLDISGLLPSITVYQHSYSTKHQLQPCISPDWSTAAYSSHYNKMKPFIRHEFHYTDGCLHRCAYFTQLLQRVEAQRLIASSSLCPTGGILHSVARWMSAGTPLFLCRQLLQLATHTLTDLYSYYPS